LYSKLSRFDILQIPFVPFYRRTIGQFGEHLQIPEQATEVRNLSSPRHSRLGKLVKRSAHVSLNDAKVSAIAITYSEAEQIRFGSKLKDSYNGFPTVALNRQLRLNAVISSFALTSSLPTKPAASRREGEAIAS
jgi:hypothetical protein